MFWRWNALNTNLLFYEKHYTEKPLDFEDVYKFDYPPIITKLTSQSNSIKNLIFFIYYLSGVCVWEGGLFK